MCAALRTLDSSEIFGLGVAFRGASDPRGAAPHPVYALAQTLPYVPEIEVIGSLSEPMPTGALQTEVSGRLIEVEVAQIAPGDFGRLADTHERAAAVLKSIFSSAAGRSARSRTDVARRFGAHCERCRERAAQLR